jgi:hypothetical protein
MKKAVILLILAFLNCGGLCHAGETKSADRFTGFYVGQLSGPHYSWDNFDPLQYLNLLRENPSRMVWACPPPKGWITREYVKMLLYHIDSTEPASAVCDFRSPHLPAREYRSTVGQEAARLIRDGYQREFYPGACSDIGRIDVNAIKDWWNKESQR